MLRPHAITGTARSDTGAAQLTSRREASGGPERVKKPMTCERSTDDIVETLRNVKARGKGCSLLIGAGCSVKAGIPTASGFVEEIGKRYPHRYARAAEKTYARCMAQLTSGERRDLIAEFVDKAKIMRNPPLLRRSVC